MSERVYLVKIPARICKGRDLNFPGYIGRGFHGGGYVFECKSGTLEGFLDMAKERFRTIEGISFVNYSSQHAEMFKG